VARKDRKSAVTRVAENRNTTTGKQFPLRLTDNDRNQLEILTDKVNDLMPNKTVAMSRVVRAMVYIQSEQQIKNIVKSIQENT